MNREANLAGYKAGAADYWDADYGGTPNPHIKSSQAFDDWDEGYNEGFSEMYDIDHACYCDICLGLTDDDYHK